MTAFKVTRFDVCDLCAIDAPDDDLVTLAYMSGDFKEGLEAFLAKRKPDWKGR